MSLQELRMKKDLDNYPTGSSGVYRGYEWKMKRLYGNVGKSRWTGSIMIEDLTIEEERQLTMTKSWNKNTIRFRCSGYPGMAINDETVVYHDHAYALDFLKANIDKIVDELRPAAH